MLLRSSCVLCDRPGLAICAPCGGSLRPAPSLAPPLGLDVCHALLDYDAARVVITSLKNGGRRDLVGWLAEAMAGLVDVPSSTTVTWAPTGAGRRRIRGYDQAELLARAVARRCELRCRPLLRRASGPAQAGRSAAERRAARLSFSLVTRCPSTVLLVDDVVTTGSTLTTAARALRAGGSPQVVALVAARSAGHLRR